MKYNRLLLLLASSYVCLGCSSSSVSHCTAANTNLIADAQNCLPTDGGAFMPPTDCTSDSSECEVPYIVYSDCLNSLPTCFPVSEADWLAQLASCVHQLDAHDGGC